MRNKPHELRNPIQLFQEQERQSNQVENCNNSNDKAPPVFPGKGRKQPLSSITVQQESFGFFGILKGMLGGLEFDRGNQRSRLGTSVHPFRLLKGCRSGR